MGEEEEISNCKRRRRRRILIVNGYFYLFQFKANIWEFKTHGFEAFQRPIFQAQRTNRRSENLEKGFYGIGPNVR